MNGELTSPRHKSQSLESLTPAAELTTAYALTLVTPRCREQVLPQTQAHEHHAALLRNGHSTTCLGTEAEKNKSNKELCQNTRERERVHKCAKNPKEGFQGRIGCCQVPRGRCHDWDPVPFSMKQPVIWYCSPLVRLHCMYALRWTICAVDGTPTRQNGSQAPDHHPGRPWWRTGQTPCDTPQRRAQRTGSDLRAPLVVLSWVVVAV